MLSAFDVVRNIKDSPGINGLKVRQGSSNYIAFSILTKKKCRTTWYAFFYLALIDHQICQSIHHIKQGNKQWTLQKYGKLPLWHRPCNTNGHDCRKIKAYRENTWSQYKRAKLHKQVITLCCRTNCKFDAVRFRTQLSEPWLKSSSCILLLYLYK